MDDAPTTPGVNTEESALAMTSGNSISGTNLLNKVRKSKDKEVSVLDASKELDELYNNSEKSNNSIQANGEENASANAKNKQPSLGRCGDLYTRQKPLS